ncbi:hypothetical protein JCM8097_005417 [Rhodosporidiobolus ruineniae]
MSKQALGLDDKPPPSLYEPFARQIRLRGRGRTREAPSGGLLGKLGLTQASLDIYPESDVVYLRPSLEENTGEEPLKGSLSLFLPKPRKLKSLTVKLVGRYDLTWPLDSGHHPVHESGVVFERTVRLLDEQGVNELELEKGEHEFEFLFLLPNNAPTWERSTNGRVRYSYQAVCSFSGALTPDLHAPARVIYPLPWPNPTPVLTPPPPLQVHVEDAFPETGPFAVDLHSQHIVVGGLLMLCLRLPSPPQTLFLHSVKLSIVQTTFITSPSDPDYPAGSPSSTFAFPPETRIVFILDQASPANNARPIDTGRGSQRRDLSRTVAPLALVHPDEGFNLVHLARLPNDNLLRPTTHPGTETPVRIESQVVIEALYREALPEEVAADAARRAGGEGRTMSPEREKGKGKGKERDLEKAAKEAAATAKLDWKKFRVSRPIELFSCLNLLDSLTLPGYEPKDPNPLDLDEGMDAKIPCFCGETLKDLLVKHGNLLIAAVHGTDASPSSCLASSSSSSSTAPLTGPSSALSSKLASLALDPSARLRPKTGRSARAPHPCGQFRDVQGGK